MSIIPCAPSRSPVSSASRGALKTIIRAFAKNEAALRMAAAAAEREEAIEVTQERFFLLVPRPEFESFFSLLSRRADDLLAPCHWLVFGSRLAEVREAKVPTFLDLVRVIQLVRERHPRLWGFTREILLASVLARVVEERRVP